MSELELNKVPKPGALDKAHIVGSALLASIPVAGGAAVELFKAIVIPPIEQRRGVWMQAIGEAILKLQEKSDNWSVNNLTQNERFITALLHATQIALRNHQREKREALRNAVIHVLSAPTVDENVQMMFFNLIDVLTPLHLKLLKLLDDPLQFAQKAGFKYPDWSAGPKSAVIEHAISDLRGRRDVYGPIARDMYSRGLIPTQELNITTTGSGMMQSITSPLGKQFLNFISTPSELSE